MEHREYQEHRAHFDYARMAREARKEEGVLRERLRIRKEAGPGRPDQELTWRRENSVLYDMCLEQRSKAMELERRAREREGVMAAYGV